MPSDSASTGLDWGVTIDGWKEAVIAWSVCASIHRDYGLSVDPFYTTRQADFIKHEADCRKKLEELLAQRKV